MSFEPKVYRSLLQVERGDALVQKVLQSGGNLETVIVELANEKEKLIASILELESIAPRKIVDAHGRTFVWHCPDSLIPKSRAIVKFQFEKAG